MILIIITIPYIGRTLDLLNLSDYVLSVYERMEDSDVKSSKGNQINNPQISFHTNDSSYSNDGILISSQIIIVPLIKYALNEIKRRNSYSKTADVYKEEVFDSAADLNELTLILQRSENHLLAIRALYISWNFSTTKSQVIIKYNFTINIVS